MCTSSVVGMDIVLMTELMPKISELSYQSLTTIIPIAKLKFAEQECTLYKSAQTSFEELQNSFTKCLETRVVDNGSLFVVVGQRFSL